MLFSCVALDAILCARRLTFAAIFASLLAGMYFLLTVCRAISFSRSDALFTACCDCLRIFASSRSLPDFFRFTVNRIAPESGTANQPW